MTSEQIRAARAILRLEQKELAERSGVSLETVKRIERTPGVISAYASTVDSLQRALEGAGVEFIPQDGGGPGVRLRQPVASAVPAPASASKRPPRSQEAPRKSTRPKRR